MSINVNQPGQENIATPALVSDTVNISGMGAPEGSKALDALFAFDKADNVASRANTFTTAEMGGLGAPVNSKLRADIDQYAGQGQTGGRSFVTALQQAKPGIQIS